MPGARRSPPGACWPRAWTRVYVPPSGYTVAPMPAAGAIVALTREVPESFARCQLVHLEREAIDVARARDQHAAYEQALAMLGCTIERLPPAPDLPDSVFVEDTAVVLPE